MEADCATAAAAGPDAVPLRSRMAISPSKMQGIFVGRFSARLGPHQKAAVRERAPTVEYDGTRSPPRQASTAQFTVCMAACPVVRLKMSVKRRQRTCITCTSDGRAAAKQP